MRNPIRSHPQCTANRARASAAGTSRCRVDARELQPLHAQNFPSRAPQVNDATAPATVPNGGSASASVVCAGDAEHKGVNEHQRTNPAMLAWVLEAQRARVDPEACRMHLRVEPGLIPIDAGNRQRQP